MLPTTTIPNSSSPSGSGVKTATVDQLLPAGGREISAVVRQVAAGDLGGQVFRIQVEANNRLLELITRAPLSSGDRITLSRSPAGELQLSLATPTPAATGATSTQARPGLLLQAAAQIALLQQALPLNSPQAARVISSTPAPPGTSVPPPAAETTTTPPPNRRDAAAAATAPLPAARTAGTAAPTVPASAASRAQLSTPTPPGGTDSAPARASATPTAPASPTPGSEAPRDTRSQTLATAPRPTNDSQVSRPAAPAMGRAQVYSAQLQQISQLGEALQAGTPGRAPASAPAAPSATAGAKGTATATAAPPTPASPGTQTADTPPRASAPAATASSAGPSAPPPAPPAPGASARPAHAAPSPPGPVVTTDSRPPASQTGATASTTPAAPATTGTAPLPARISLTGNTLLQTLGQQQPRQPTPHLVQLSVGSQQLQLISPRPLQAGQQVTLTRVGDQQVQLQGMPAAELPGRSPAAQNAMQQALREALPQQIPFGDALNQLVQLSQTPAARGQGAIGQLVQSMLSLFSVTPGSADADQAIQRNLQQGGLLSESQLARSGGSDKPPTDLKQQLGQLLKAAEQLPPEPRQQMQRLVEALQARTTSHQVSSLQAWKELPDGGQERVFRLDLPIRQAEHHDTAELTISEQRRPDPEGDWQTSWSVALNFDLQQQGSVDVRLSLQEGWRLQLQFWAEASATLRRIEQQLDPFTQTLHDKGFIVDRIQARQGKPQQAKLNDIQRRLVDVHT